MEVIGVKVTTQASTTVKEARSKVKLIINFENVLNKDILKSGTVSETNHVIKVNIKILNLCKPLI